MTCSKYNVYKRKAPGLITQAMMMMKNTWSFTVTKLALAWEKSSDGIGTMAGLMWRGLKGLLGLVGKIWNGLLGLVDQVCEIWSGLTGLVDWIVSWITRLAKGMYSGSFWLAESIWNNIVYLPHLIWNGTLGMAEWVKEKIIWLAEISQKIALWSAGKTCSGSRWLAEWTWMEAKWSAEWIWKVIERSCKPIEPVFEYLWETIEVVTQFYNEYVHEHVIKIQSHLVFSTWRETAYTISTVLVLNCVVVTVYMLISWPVKSIWRRWQAYKEWKAAEEASWRLPPRRQPQPNERVWENPKKKKLHRNKNE
ncbi:hypothetical protein pdam_00005747 [Pocillopora damicornis]|uniref:Uncharacterized protein n=1 Tax=Pocillopora damicornis TaxID=46731 RepID=A0A3M6UVC0_POCDA|nr:uncharacterized protein LOC113684267 [Pocillopora damicornis]RMX57567.1 hypothetical protein pdam_00005747 [Pocillopora damicornis]